jgi:hypothetical protein
MDQAAIEDLEKLIKLNSIIVRVKNITDKPVTVPWDGVPVTIQPGQSVPVPSYKAEALCVQAMLERNPVTGFAATSRLGVEKNDFDGGLCMQWPCVDVRGVSDQGGEVPGFSEPGANDVKAVLGEDGAVLLTEGAETFSARSRKSLKGV